MTIELTVAIGLVCTMLGVVATLAGKKRAERQDAAADGKNDGVILTEVGYIKSGIDDIKRKQEQQDEKYIGHEARMVAVEASTKQAHHRIDRIEKKEGV